jgi:hypothetical protein
MIYPYISELRIWVVLLVDLEKWIVETSLVRH